MTEHVFTNFRHFKATAIVPSPIWHHPLKQQ